ncbi:hypothetical protein D1007_10007 [Hordeum vulgare]|nr:hypothetical protein D1007_10007 [Hordeum vulgare]
MADDEEDQIPFFSQFPSHQQATQGSSAGRNLGRGMGFLDLNSNVDVFLELGSYQQLHIDQSAVMAFLRLDLVVGGPCPRAEEAAAGL